MEEKIDNSNIELTVVRTDTRVLETRSFEYVENIVKTLA
jgi:hypothetical protein